MRVTRNVTTACAAIVVLVLMIAIGSNNFRPVFADPLIPQYISPSIGDQTGAGPFPENGGYSLNRSLAPAAELAGTGNRSPLPLLMPENGNAGGPALPLVSAATVILEDSFNRADNPVVGENWVEVEREGAFVDIANWKLFFAETSDVVNQPLVRRSFDEVTTGTLEWGFDFDWVRTGDENIYRVLMQLGDGDEMQDDSQDAGVGVNLVWTVIDGEHQSLGYGNSGSITPLDTISGPAHISVSADLESQTYSVSVDGDLVNSGIPFDDAVPLNTVRFLTDQLNEEMFSGRTFDNVFITAEAESNQPPGSNAGEDQEVEPGATVTLDGSGSTDADGDDLTYSWRLTTVPEESTAELIGAETATPSFVADRAGSYEAELVVNDGRADSEPDRVSIEANTPPEAAAGEDQFVITGATVSLDGSGSTDADGDDLTYSWRLTTVPEESTAELIGAETATPSFVADRAGSYEAELVVNDGKADSEPDRVSIEANTPPEAAAGEDQFVITGDTVTLDGSGSTDADGDDLTYRWRLTTVPEESTAELIGAETATPSFVADRAGSYEAELVVNDGRADSEPDRVSIEANTAPVASAGDDQNVEPGATVSLDGSGSTDADGDDLTYRWRLTTVPEGSTLALTGAGTAELTGAETATPSFVADRAGTYEAELVVNDGKADSEPDRVSIEANTPPEAAAGDDQNVETGDTVTLDGSGSTDADGDDLTYRWRLTTVPEGSTLALTGAGTAGLTGAETATPSFVADRAGTYEAELIVNDGKVDSEPDTVSIEAAVPGPTILLEDTFTRPDSSLVGGGWVEVEETGATVSIDDEKLFFDATSDAIRRPVASRTFTSVSTGTLNWEFDFDWTNVGTDIDYELWMQLGDGTQMLDTLTNPNTGVGVDLRWGNIGAFQQRLVARQNGGGAGVRSLDDNFSGKRHLTVTVDLDTRSYSVNIDGAVVGLNLAFDDSANVTTLDTVRFLTNSMLVTSFTGRTFDNVVISAE